MTHLLDSSALLAFILGETGAVQVRGLIEDENNRIAVSILAKIELWSVLKSIWRESEFEQEWALHLALFEAVLDVDRAVADFSLSLRLGASVFTSGAGNARPAAKRSSSRQGGNWNLTLGGALARTCGGLRCRMKRSKARRTFSCGAAW